MFVRQLHHSQLQLSASRLCWARSWCFCLCIGNAWLVCACASMNGSTTNRGRCITPWDPLHFLALITVVKRPSRVVIPVAFTPKISAGVHRDHFQDTSATRTLVAHLSHLLGFNFGHSYFFKCTRYSQTRIVSAHHHGFHHAG